MTQQERNLEIAKMIGMKIEHGYIINWKNFGHLMNSIEDSIKFHSNWNWLMVAIEFIKEIDNQDKNEEMVKNRFLFFLLPITTPIDIVFKNVSDFAKIYNKVKL